MTCNNCAALTESISHLEFSRGIVAERLRNPEGGDGLEAVARLIADDPDNQMRPDESYDLQAIGAKINALAAQRDACAARNHRALPKSTDELILPAEEAPAAGEENPLGPLFDVPSNTGGQSASGGKPKKLVGWFAASCALAATLIISFAMLGGADKNDSSSNGTDNPLGDLFDSTTIASKIPSAADGPLKPNPLPVTFTFTSDGSCPRAEYSQPFEMRSRILPDGTIALELTQVDSGQITVGSFAPDMNSATTSGKGPGYVENYLILRVEPDLLGGEYTYRTDDDRTCGWKISAPTPANAWSTGPP